MKEKGSAEQKAENKILKQQQTNKRETTITIFLANKCINNIYVLQAKDKH